MSNQIVYNVFTGTFDFVGSGNTGANTTLSNLTAPTAINQDLLPGVDNSINLGSSTKRIASGNFGTRVNVGIYPPASGQGLVSLFDGPFPGIEFYAGGSNAWTWQTNGSYLYTQNVGAGVIGMTTVEGHHVFNNSSGSALFTIDTTGITFSAPSISAGSVTIQNVADPVNPQDAETLHHTAATYIPLTQRASANGVATLDSGGKIPLGQLPASLMEYQGTWDASTNTPTLADGAGVSGYFYRVQVGGTQNLGSGSQTFVVGDWIMYNGSIWQLAHAGADAVISVNGSSGVVTVNAINQLTGDITAGPASGSQSVVATLATVNPNAGTFGTAQSVPVLVVNGKGLITNSSSTPIQITESQVTNLVSDLAGKQATGNYITALTGDVVATGPGSVSATIQSGSVTLAKMANLAANSFIGNNTGSPATPIALTQVQATAALNQFTSSLQGLVPASGGGTTNFLRADGSWSPAGTGTVTAVSVANANGFSGSSSGGTTPALTLTTTIAGLVKGNGTALSAAIAGTDYSAGTSALSTGILKSTTSTGALTIAVAGDFPTLNQNTTGTATNVTGTVALLNGGTGVAAGSANAAFNALSPLTTKGDTLVYSTINARQAVPNDYGSLVPDSTQATGWRSVPYNQIKQGSPGKNYIQYADFENNSTTGWSLGTIGTLINGLPTGTPTFGSGSSGNLSIATTATSLAGTYSLNYISTAATTVGNMLASSSYPIDPVDQGKVLGIKFIYNPSSGSTNCNFSGTSSNSFAWAIYDITNSSWLSSVGNFNFIQSSGSQYVTGTVQTNINTANIRLCIYNVNATAGAATITLDDFFIGSQVSVSAPAISDWVAYTPTINGFGVPSNVAFQYRRVGDSIDIRGAFTSGTSTSVQAQVFIPPGLTISSTKLTGSILTIEGIGALSTTGDPLFMQAAAGVSYLTIGRQGTGTGLNQFFGNQIATSTQSISFEVNGIPIAGWSSNSVASSDTDTRVIAASYSTLSSTAITSGTPLSLTVINYDTSGSKSGSSYVAPISGKYHVTYSGTYSTGGGADVQIFVAGVVRTTIGTIGTSRCSTSGTVDVTAGQAITIVPNGSVTAGDTVGNLFIERLSGPAVITATESVNARYFSSTTPLTSGTTFTTITYATKSRDSHMGYSGGTYSIPISGMYQINAIINISGTYSGGQQAAIAIFQNGNSVSEGDGVTSGSSAIAIAQVSDAIPCIAGDLITIRAYSQAVSPSILSSNTRNYFSITRVGN